MHYGIRRLPCVLPDASLQQFYEAVDHIVVTSPALSLHPRRSPGACHFGNPADIRSGGRVTRSDQGGPCWRTLYEPERREIRFLSQAPRESTVKAEMGIVGKWRSRFLKARLEGLYDEPRPGAPRKVTDAQVEQREAK
jgi:hypothetical protein